MRAVKASVLTASHCPKIKIQTKFPCHLHKDLCLVYLWHANIVCNFSLRGQSSWKGTCLNDRVNTEKKPFLLSSGYIQQHLVWGKRRRSVISDCRPATSPDVGLTNISITDWVKMSFVWYSLKTMSGVIFQGSYLQRLISASDITDYRSWQLCVCSITWRKALFRSTLWPVCLPEIKQEVLASVALLATGRILKEALPEGIIHLPHVGWWGNGRS